MRKLCLLASAAALACPAFASNLVNDTFSDTDRNAGLGMDPVVITSTNTQWITNTALTPSASGMLWDTALNTGSRYALGYFPLVSVNNNEPTPTIFTIGFRTGASGATASNLRMALIDSRPNGIATADGSPNNPVFNGDVGYGFFSSASTVGGGGTTNLTLRTYQRNGTSSNDLLSSAGDWGNNTGTNVLANSVGATGYFQPNTDYTLSLTMLLSGGTLSIQTTLTGGNFVGMSYNATDSVSPTTEFDAFVMRMGGPGQFADINFTSFTVSGVVPEPSSAAALLGLGALGFGLSRRRRTV